MIAAFAVGQRFPLAGGSASRARSAFQLPPAPSRLGGHVLGPEAHLPCVRLCGLDSLSTAPPLQLGFNKAVERIVSLIHRSL